MDTQALKGQLREDKSREREREKRIFPNQPETQHFSTGEHITPPGKCVFFKFGQGRKERKKKKRNPKQLLLPGASLVTSLYVCMTASGFFFFNKKNK